MRYAGILVLACLALVGCSGEREQASAETAFTPTPHYRPRLLAQSGAGHPLATRDTARDAVWWSFDLRRAPIDRTRRLLDIDGSHVDETGIGIGRLPPPPGEATNIEMQPFGGCSPPFYVRYIGRRTLLCNRDKTDVRQAEAEFARLASNIVRRFDLRPGTMPVTQRGGTRLLAVQFAQNHGTRRAYSPVLDKVMLSRTGNRVLLAIMLRPDTDWTKVPQHRQGDALDRALDGS